MQNSGAGPKIRMPHNLLDDKCLGLIQTRRIGDACGGVLEPLPKLARRHSGLGRQPRQNTLVGEILRLQPNHVGTRDPVCVGGHVHQSHARAVHGIGVSPAVTIPTLMQAVGPGAARTLVMGGALIEGPEALRIGLATHLAESDETVAGEAMELCRMLEKKPHEALRTTKAWLNELDGSLDDARFDGPVEGSVELAGRASSQALLRKFWKDR